MKTRNILIAAMLAIFAGIGGTAAAFADAHDDGGARFYAGAGGGIAFMDDLEDDCDQRDLDCDESVFSYKGFAGIRLNQHFGGELGYYRADGFDFDDGDEYNFSGFYGAALAYIPLSESIEGFAKIGFHSGEQEYDWEDSCGGIEYSGVMFGAGAQIPVSRIIIRAEWERFTNDLGDYTDDCFVRIDRFDDSAEITEQREEGFSDNLDLFSVSAIYQF